MKVIVIGAGLAGSATAYFLAQAGCEVVVVDRQQGAGLETSFANGGMITPSQADPWNRPGVLATLIGGLAGKNASIRVAASALPLLRDWGFAFLRNSTRARYRNSLERNVRLAGFSLAQQRELTAALSLDYGLANAGTMKIFGNAHVNPAAGEIGAWLAECGVRFEMLDAEGVIAREPALAPVRNRIAGGIYYPDDASGDAHAFCRQILEQAARAGARLRFGSPVRALLSGAGRIDGVRLDAETLHAQHVVLAAGSYSPRLAGPVGLRLPVRPIKGYSVTLPFQNWPGAPVVPIIDDDRHIAVTPLDGRLRVAGTAEFAGYDLHVDPRRIESMIAFVLSVYPDFGSRLDRARVNPWAGLRPYSCDGVPILGRTRVPGLYLNTGHGHLGWSMALGSARLVADQMLGRPCGIELAPYALGRFGD